MVAVTDEQWFQAHAEYLATDSWRRRRTAVFARDRGQCQAVLDGCTGAADEVHHLSYKHWRNEPLFDLTAVCRNCHRIITLLDRGEQAQRMLAAYGLSDAASAASKVTKLRAMLAKYEPRQLDASRLDSYCHIEVELASAQGVSPDDMPGHTERRRRHVASMMRPVA